MKKISLIFREDGDADEWLKEISSVTEVSCYVRMLTSRATIKVSKPQNGRKKKLARTKGADRE